MLRNGSRFATGPATRQLLLQDPQVRRGELRARCHRPSGCTTPGAPSRTLAEATRWDVQGTGYGWPDSTPRFPAGNLFCILRVRFSSAVAVLVLNVHGERPGIVGALPRPG